MKGADLEGIRFRHPSLRARFGRRSRRVRHARRGHWRGAHGARPRRGRLQHRHALRARDLRADRAGRSLQRERRAVRRPACVRREPEGRRGAEGTRPALASRDVRASVSALLALPQPGDLPGDVAVVHLDGQRPAEAGRYRSGGSVRLQADDAPRSRHRRDRQQGEVDPVVGARPDLQHGQEPSRLVHLAPARRGACRFPPSTARSAARRS